MCASISPLVPFADWVAAIVAVPVASAAFDPTVVEFRTNSTVEPGGALMTNTVWAVAMPAATVSRAATAMRRRHAFIVFGFAVKTFLKYCSKHGRRATCPPACRCRQRPGPHGCSRGGDGDQRNAEHTFDVKVAPQGNDGNAPPQRGNGAPDVCALEQPC